MKNDLISRSALLGNGLKVRCGLNDNGLIFVPMADVRKSIEEATAVDAVAVVRCKDCKHYHDFETHFDCNHVCGMDYVQPTDFCSYGERRENHDE